MARWKPIESAPIGRPILVDGGTLQYRDGHGEANTPIVEPMKIKFDGHNFCVDPDSDIYVVEPLFWTDLPERHITLALPRPASQEFDL